jgi:pimeloyl-ACP methyl ester carboxylesterase
MREQVQLPDGRGIDYRDFGDAEGAPALYLHGTPSSASEGRWLHTAARAAEVRLVALDRPGYLGSQSPVPPSLLGAAADVAAVGDALELSRFAVVGFSGGAAYALATAYVAPERVTVVHVGGGVGSLAGDRGKVLPWPRRAPFLLGARAPRVAAPVVGGGMRLFRRAIEKRLDSPKEAAAWFFEGPAQGAQIEAVARYVDATPPDELRDDLRDHARATASTQAILADLTAYARPWPFELADIAAPVEIWHGVADPAAPFAFAERAAAELPDATLHAFEGEGHFVFHAHADAIAASIAAHALQAALC